MAAAEPDELRYIGFWRRFWASVVDGFLLGVIITPILLHVYGDQYWLPEDFLLGPLDFLLSYVFPAIAVIMFWIYKAATPGKMAVSAVIVDAATGGRPSNAQFIGRYFSYIVSGVPLGLGFLWIAFDKRKQGWHDKLAGTLVVRKTE